jgi:UDP-glucose 4-epimerase
MKGKTVVVTGGAGVVGSNLVRRLIEDGARVIVVDNHFAGSSDAHVAGAEYRIGSTKDIAALVPENPDVIYHLGEYARVEQSLKEPDVVWDLNAVGSHAVFELWRAKKPKLIYAGSSTKFADDGLARDATPYAWVKAINTEKVKNYAAWYGLPYAITYFYNVFGPGERAGQYGTLIEIFRQKRLKGEKLTVTSPGTQRRNFTHVHDIVDGLILVGEKGEGDGYALGNEQDFSVLDIAEMYGGEIEMMPEAQGNRMKGFIDTSKARALGWKALRSVEDYIRDAIQ